MSATQIAIGVTAVCAGLGWLWWMFVTAPLGYEDSEGWREGIQPLEHSDYDGE